MITVPAYRDLLKPGAPVLTRTGQATVFEAYKQPIARVVFADGDTEAYTLAEMQLILDDPDRIGQTLALAWLARRLGVLMPVVGCPEVYRFGGVGGVLFFFGVPSEWLAGMLNSVECPALDNPTAADAPIRALALAVVTVGGAP